MTKERKIIATICIILAITLIGTLIVPNILKHNKVKDDYYEHEVYRIEQYDNRFNQREFSEIIESKNDYENFLSLNEIELDEDDLEDIKEKDYENYNYILVVISTNSCGEKIELEEVKQDKKREVIDLNFEAEETCGLCAMEYDLYEIAVPNKIDYGYRVNINWDIDEANCDPNVAYKPILYLYPKQETNIKVNFSNEDNLTTTYPKFNKEWNVLAKPNGDLYDSNNNYYYALYWEEKTYSKVNFEEGFYISKTNAITFLEEKLTILGLNPKERNEFIMYWLPILENNEHNLVYFELTEDLQKQNELIITPQPDTLIRIRMHVKKVSETTNINEQQLPIQERTGYTAIEWGGVIHK